MNSNRTYCTRLQTHLFNHTFFTISYIVELSRIDKYRYSVLHILIRSAALRIHVKGISISLVISLYSTKQELIIVVTATNLLQFLVQLPKIFLS
jgi:hypothetical protein